MLSKNDMTALRGLMHEVITETVPGMMRENNEIFGAQLKREIRDEIHSLIQASEAGLIRRIDAMEERLHKDLEEFIDDNYSPRMYEAEQQIIKISGHLKLA